MAPEQLGRLPREPNGRDQQPRHLLLPADQHQLPVQELLARGPEARRPSRVPRPSRRGRGRSVRRQAAGLVLAAQALLLSSLGRLLVARGGADGQEGEGEGERRVHELLRGHGRQVRGQDGLEVRVAVEAAAVRVGRVEAEGLAAVLVGLGLFLLLLADGREGSARLLRAGRARAGRLRLLLGGRGGIRVAARVRRQRLELENFVEAAGLTLGPAPLDGLLEEAEQFLQ